MTYIVLFGGAGSGKFQSTCHIRGMTLSYAGLSFALAISIHMPHTWHDVAQQRKKLIVRHFNPHATYVA